MEAVSDISAYRDGERLARYCLLRSDFFFPIRSGGVVELKSMHVRLQEVDYDALILYFLELFFEDLAPAGTGNVSYTLFLRTAVLAKNPPFFYAQIFALCSSLRVL